MPLHSSPHPSLTSASSAPRRRPFAAKTNAPGSPTPAPAPSARAPSTEAEFKPPKPTAAAAAPRPASSKPASGRSTSSMPRRTRRDGSRRDDPPPPPRSSNGAAAAGVEGRASSSAWPRTRSLTPVELENDPFGFGASLAAARTSQPIRHCSPRPSTHTQRPTTPEPLSDLPSTPSSHRPPSDVDEAEERIDEILGRKRRGTPEPGVKRGGPKKSMQETGGAKAAGKRKKRTGMRTRAHDVEPESESEEDDEMDLNVPVASPVPVDGQLPSPRFHNVEDADTTLRSSDGQTPAAAERVPAPPAKGRDKTSSPSLDSDDFYS